MIWIISSSGMSAQFLEACINNEDLKQTSLYELIETKCKFGSFTELGYQWEGVKLPLKLNSSIGWQDSFIDGLERARELGKNALFTHRGLKEPQAINWMMSKGDTIVRLRHVNNYPLWLCRESVQTPDTSDDYFIDKLKMKLHQQNEVPSYLSVLPYLDQNDYLTVCIEKLQHIAPIIDKDIFESNLFFYLEKNMQGIKDWKSIERIMRLFFQTKISF